jgi:glycyl-tRNA synthetase beta chain
MTDFLLELRSEEIPARMQDDARQNLKRLFEGELAKAGLKADDIATYATPRRLALIAYGLPLETQAVSEELKGPKTAAPPQALEGFLRKTGLTQEQLVERDGVYFAVIEKAGRKTADVLAEAIPAIIRAFPWPKSMRWGAASQSTESLRWVRPLQGIVALLGDDVIQCGLDGIIAGSSTMGHRFHHSGAVTIGNAGDYETKLRACHVIVDQHERENIIRQGAQKVAGDAGLVLVQDPGLVTENAGLTEWPVPMLGRFDPAFLAVPEEVIQLTARVNQKYFICRDGAGKLANAFVCTANIVAHDGGAAIVAGNEKVLAARLSDAKFFWEQDLKVRLEDQAKKLNAIVFHEKLGTVADKVERVAKLARWLVEEGIVKGASADDAERAARLCKADLVTGMVGEFPELQGIMGGYYAREQGQDDPVADAIRDHYKPVGQGDDVPTAPVTVAVSLADKLDTICQFFMQDLKPTGSKDPFALRRAALGIISLAKNNKLRLGIVLAAFNSVLPSLMAEQLETDRAPLLRALSGITELISKNTAEHFMRGIAATVAEMPKPNRFDPKVFERAVRVSADIRDFLLDRLEVSERQDGIRFDIVRAAQVIDGDRGKEDDLVRLLARVKALQAFVGTDEGTNLLAGYKRAANILKQNPSPLAGEGGAIASGEGRAASAAQKNLLAADAAAPSPSAPDGAPPSPAGGEGLLEAERALLAALDTAEPLATSAIEREDFEAAMTALASLRAPIDAFFEGVMVNDPDPDKRAYRLGLLTRFRDAVHCVADFSKIEG